MKFEDDSTPPLSQEAMYRKYLWLNRVENRRLQDELWRRYQEFLKRVADGNR